MKKYVLLICLLLLIIIIVVTYFVLTNRKSTPIGEIKSMSFSYTKGYMMNSDVRYEIEYLDGKYIAKYKPYGESAEKSKRIDTIIAISKQRVVGVFSVGSPSLIRTGVNADRVKFNKVVPLPQGYWEEYISKEPFTFNSAIKYL